MKCSKWYLLICHPWLAFYCQYYLLSLRNAILSVYKKKNYEFQCIDRVHWRRQENSRRCLMSKNIVVHYRTLNILEFTLNKSVNINVKKKRLSYETKCTFRYSCIVCSFTIKPFLNWNALCIHIKCYWLLLHLTLYYSISLA